MRKPRWMTKRYWLREYLIRQYKRTNRRSVPFRATGAPHVVKAVYRQPGCKARVIMMDCMPLEVWRRRHRTRRPRG